jgi:hypothetical protein
MAHFGSVNAPHDASYQRPSFARTPQAGTAQATPERVNAYGAKCAKCQVWVEPGQGRLTSSLGQWRVSHIPPCPEREVTPNVEPETLVAPASAPKVAFKVPDGRYTVVFADGHKTLRVATQGNIATFMPGKVIISFLSGSDNDHDYTSFANVDDQGGVKIWKKHQGNESLREALKVVLGDAKAASKAYAVESGCCGICGRSLTTPESVARQMGPTCAAKNGWL